MAQNQLVPVATPAKPDPKIEQSLAKTAEFLREYVPPVHEVQKDILDEQFKIDLSTPLPQYDTPHAKAYAALDLQDSRPLYALVCAPGSVQRHNVIERMRFVRNENLITVVAAGPMELTQPAEERFVVFFERAKGQKLSLVLANLEGRVPNNLIISRIIAPITGAILALQDQGITHGNICPENIYFENHAVLGPCVTEPCGYSQPFYYELVERMQAHPAGKGDTNIGTDFYALAVLVLEIIAGKQQLERLPPAGLARAILRQGPFMALTGGRDMPEEFFDFLWGMLGSGNSQRWNYRYLKPWLDGKHYNIIPAPPPTEGAKPYECFGTTGHSRREIAHLMRTHWDKVFETLGKHSLPQWILMVLRQKDYSELVGRHVRTILEGTAKNEAQRNEHIMRLILILDDIGPIEYVNISFHPDGIPNLLVDLYAQQKQEEMTNLIRFIEYNLIAAWTETQQLKEIPLSEEMSQLIMKLDRARTMLRHRGLGFGVERLLYDLNPELPCLSPLCEGRHITNMPDLLRHLDRIAPKYANMQDPIDAHIAAFAASKLNISGEMKLHDLSAIPGIADNKSLLALKLFAVAQHRSGNIALSGLTHWIAQRVLPSMQHLRSTTVRDRTLQMLLDEAEEGRTQNLGDLMLDGEIVNVDQDGFEQAVITYKRNSDRIQSYRRGVNLAHDSAQLGNTIAKIFAYTALLMSIYNIFMSY